MADYGRSFCADCWAKEKEDKGLKHPDQAGWHFFVDGKCIRCNPRPKSHWVTMAEMIC